MKQRTSDAEAVTVSKEEQKPSLLGNVRAAKVLLSIGKDVLRDAGIEEADLDAAYLLEFVTGLTRMDVILDPNKTVSEEKIRAYEDALQKRAQRIPLQHITGEQYFFGYRFLVNAHVLIPRQDTEILVEEALKRVQDGDRVLDMCTGSGCILLSMLKYAEERDGKRLMGCGADISADALAVARENAKQLSVPAGWYEGDLFAGIPQGEHFQMIVSNPPYIPTAVIDSLQEEVKLHDPRGALDGHADGLHFYRRIVKEAGAYLSEGGRLLVEIGYDQREAVEGLFREAGFTDVFSKKDLAGLDRVVGGVVR